MVEDNLLADHSRLDLVFDQPYMQWRSVLDDHVRRSVSRFRPGLELPTRLRLGSKLCQGYHRGLVDRIPILIDDGFESNPLATEDVASFHRPAARIRRSKKPRWRRRVQKRKALYHFPVEFTQQEMGTVIRGVRLDTTRVRRTWQSARVSEIARCRIHLHHGREMVQDHPEVPVVQNEAVLARFTSPQVGDQLPLQ